MIELKDITQLISILMPVYNVEKYVGEAVQSIINQTYRNFELIILDDGSKDNTVPVIKSFNDSRIRLYENEHLGLSEQLNYGISVANGDFIARMDGDDISKNERLEKQLLFLTKHPEIDIIGTSYEFIDKNGKSKRTKILHEIHSEISASMPVLTSVCHASILARKNVFQLAQGYNNIAFCEDQDLFLRLINQGFKFHNMKEVLYLYREPAREKTQKEIEILHFNMRKTGLSYIEKNYDTYKKNKNYFFTIGLIEYYHGKISVARKYFFKAIKENPNQKIIRYLLPTFLGEGLFRLLRNTGVFSGISNFINRVLKFDFHSVL